MFFFLVRVSEVEEEEEKIERRDLKIESDLVSKLNGQEKGDAW